MLLATVAVAALVASVVLAGPPSSELPLDPRGVGPQGLGGLVEVLESLDVDVTVRVDPPGDTASRALLPVDRLDETTRGAWAEWLEEGGTLVLADPDSPLADLAPVGSDRLFGRENRSPACELLPEVAAVRQAAWEGLEVPDDAEGCFPVGDDDGAWLVAAPRGDGLLVALGSAEALTNALLDQADNAVLAASLLGPAPGDRLVIVPRDPTPGTQEDGLLALVADRVWTALALGLLALVLAVVWQGRRDGPVVHERLPPVLPSAELARSVAGLLQRAGDRDDGAERLRRGTRRTTAKVLGLPPDTAPAGLLHAVTERTDVARSDAEVALGTGRVDDDAALVEVAAACRRLRADLRRPPASPRSAVDDPSSDRADTARPSDRSDARWPSDPPEAPTPFPDPTRS